MTTLNDNQVEYLEDLLRIKATPSAWLKVAIDLDSKRNLAEAGFIQVLPNFAVITPLGEQQLKDHYKSQRAPTYTRSDLAYGLLDASPAIRNKFYAEYDKDPKANDDEEWVYFLMDLTEE